MNENNDFTLFVRVVFSVLSLMKCYVFVIVSELAGEQFGIHIPDMKPARLNPHKPSVRLVHQPKFVRHNDMSDFDVVLCGHTHAGQVFPLSLFVWLDQHYVYGLYTLANAKKHNFGLIESFNLLYLLLLKVTFIQKILYFGYF